MIFRLMLSFVDTFFPNKKRRRIITMHEMYGGQDQWYKTNFLSIVPLDVIRSY